MKRRNRNGVGLIEMVLVAAIAAVVLAAVWLSTSAVARNDQRSEDRTVALDRARATMERIQIDLHEHLGSRAELRDDGALAIAGQGTEIVYEPGEPTVRTAPGRTWVAPAGVRVRFERVDGPGIRILVEAGDVTLEAIHGNETERRQAQFPQWQPITANDDRAPGAQEAAR